MFRKTLLLVLVYVIKSMCVPGMCGVHLPKMFHSEVSVFGSYNEQVNLLFGVLCWISFVLELVEAAF